jgi:hypothetical protein
MFGKFKNSKQSMADGLSKPGRSKSAVSNAHTSWLWVKESDRENFFELTPRGQLAQASHQSHEPWLDDANLQVISFCKEDDLEVRAEARESEVAMQKRIMADVGVKIVSWAQALKTDSGQTPALEGLKKLGSHFLESKASAQPTQSSKSSSDSLVSGVWMYATAQARMKSIPAQSKVWSGIALVRYMLAQAFQSMALPETPFVTGVVFSGEPTAVIVFLKCEADGQFSMQQVARLSDMSEEAFEAACTNFAEHARLGRALPKERIKLFDGAHLMDLMDSSKTRVSTSAKAPVRAYPAEVEIFGVRQSTWLRVAMYASAVAMAVDLVWGLSALGMAASTHSQNQQIKRELDQLSLTRKTAIDARFGTLIKEGAIPVRRLIDEARSMYRDGMRLEIDSTRDMTVYRVSRRFQDEASQPAAMAELLQIRQPENCARSAPEVTLQLNEVFINVQCKTVDPYLARLLGSGS